MATLVEMEAQLETLRTARTKGVRSVEYDNKRVEYRTDSEISAAIADLETRIAAQRPGRISMIRTYTSKGL